MNLLVLDSRKNAMSDHAVATDSQEYIKANDIIDWNMKIWLSLFANYADSKQSGGKMFIKMQSKYKLAHNYEKMRELPLRLFLHFFLL